ncbi:MAG: AAA family ATPase, partial [Cyclobacteriaceae bacterium]
MTSKDKHPLPPYLGIDPKQAAERLNDPIHTERFAKAASFAARGREELAKGGHAPDGKKRLRRFSTWEICRYLIPVAPAHFRRVLKAQPDLPQGVGEGNSKWFSLEEVISLRDHFAEEGAAHREYRPFRPAGLNAKVLAVANFKGGVGKTSTCAHLAMSAALDGYRVLVVDLDSQGSMTSIMGGSVQDEWQTAFPILARDYALHVESENKVRAARSEAPISLDETLKEALEVSPRNLVQKTHWPNIDLIGAQLNLY